MKGIGKEVTKKRKERGTKKVRKAEKEREKLKER